MKFGGGHNLGSTLAFTLAEVLVTLGIIGVVSAMTVPTLMQNHQRKTYVTQLHKFYNQLSQALVRFQTDKNAVNLKEAGLVDNFDYFWTSYFNIVQDCGTSSTPCFPKEGSYRMLNNSSASPYTTQKRFITLADGVSIGYGKNNVFPLCIDVDINGVNGPNIAGRDVFVIYIYSNGAIDDYINGAGENDAPLTVEQREQTFQNNCYSSSGNWIGCLGKILNDNWEMTY